jgi:hypothetical protein
MVKHQIKYRQPRIGRVWALLCTYTVVFGAHTAVEPPSIDTPPHSGIFVQDNGSDAAPCAFLGA